jgi:hypothetical protein
MFNELETKKHNLAQPTKREEVIPTSEEFLDNYKKPSVIEKVIVEDNDPPKTTRTLTTEKGLAKADVEEKADENPKKRALTTEKKLAKADIEEEEEKKEEEEVKRKKTIRPMNLILARKIRKKLGLY